MSKEVYTLNPYKQVLLSEKDYLELAAKANANEELIKQKAQELYQMDGIATLAIILDVCAGGNFREYAKVKVNRPNLIQSSSLGRLPDESIRRIQDESLALVKEWYAENVTPIEEQKAELKRLTSRAKFWWKLFLTIVIVGALSGIIDRLVFYLLK